MKVFYPNKMITIEADSQEEADKKFELQIKGDSALKSKKSKDASKTDEPISEE